MSSRLMMGALMAGALVATAASPARACKGADVIFSDNFSVADEAWSDPDPATGTMTIADGKLTIKNKPNKLPMVLYNGDVFPGGDLCVDIALPAVKDPTTLETGVVLSASDSWYYVEFDGTGNAWVYRYKGGTSLPLVKYRPVDGFKTDPGATNQLRIVWKAPQPAGSETPSDPKVSVYFNDKEFATFKATPFNGRQFGLVGGGTPAASFAFSNLTVTNPPE